MARSTCLLACAAVLLLAPLGCLAQRPGFAPLPWDAMYTQPSGSSTTPRPATTPAIDLGDRFGNTGPNGHPGFGSNGIYTINGASVGGNGANNNGGAPIGVGSGVNNGINGNGIGSVGSSNGGLTFRVFNNVPIQGPESPCVGCLYRLTRQGFVRVNLQPAGGNLQGTRGDFWG